jgi:microcystin-dependent protein
MSNPFIGEIRMVGFNFAPQGWAFCSGQLMSIAQNNALFALVGTTYGGDGQNTFGLPDLRGRVPIHQGQSPGTSNYQIGQQGGTETVTLISSQLPAHTHPVAAAAGGNDTNASSGMPASGGPNLYATGAGTPPAPMTVMPTGGNQPHENMAPYVAISFVICLFGIFPSQN